MEQLNFDKADATRRYLATCQKMQSMVKEKTKKQSVLKKLDSYKQA